MIEAALTIARAVKAGFDVYGTVSAILRGKQSNRLLERISNDLGNMKIEFERISNRITMARNLDAVQDVTQSRQRHVEDLRDVREALEPVQKAVGDDILSSAMIWTPEKMKKAMGQNPWEVLLFIQPVALAKPPNDPNLTPIIFEHSGVQYIGWQAKGTLPMLFDCHYEELWKPNSIQRGKIVSPQEVPQTNQFKLEDPETLFQRGLKYANGDGVAKNSTEALKWYRKAAEQGHASAQYSLGRMYQNGTGVARDPAEAVRWYRKAAEQDNARAQCNLGFMYGTGKGVAQDSVEAVRWYRKAAEQGDVRAQDNLGIMYDHGKGIAQDLVEAVRWYRKAAEQGDAKAQCNLGFMYDRGRGVAQDPIESVHWYRKAAEQGNARAQCSLGFIYDTGEGVARDPVKAAYWLRKAAEQGDVFAKIKLDYLNRRSTFKTIP